MAKKLFVGGLSWDTMDDGMRQAFAVHGEVTEAKVITDRDNGRSREFGFVTLVQDEDAKTAIAKTDGTSLDGKTIKVNEAQEKSPRGGGRPSGGFGGGTGADVTAGSSEPGVRDREKITKKGGEMARVRRNVYRLNSKKKSPPKPFRVTSAQCGKEMLMEVPPSGNELLCLDCYKKK